MTFKYQIIQLYIWGREMQRFDDLQKNKQINCTHLVKKNPGLIVKICNYELSDKIRSLQLNILNN